MSDLSEKEFRTVIDDVRARHTAVVALIYHTDTQAAGLLRIYLTVGVAAASGAYGVLAAYPAMAVALGSAAAMTIVGSTFCLFAMRAARIRLPGNDPDFWIWASRADVTPQLVLAQYLDQLAGGSTKNADVNESSSRALNYAKAMVVVTLAVAATAGALAAKIKL